MIEKDTDVVSILEKLLSDKPQEKLEEIGTVIKVGDGICKVYGLKNAIFGELVVFEGGSKGLVLNLDEDYVSVVLLDSNACVIEQEIAKRTKTVFSIPVGEHLVGRVVDARGYAIDACGDIDNSVLMPIERTIAGIAQRSPINRPLETGITAIDCLIPIGKGQRELIIGNRGTGKTSLILDTMLHQKGKDVICIYVSIGHKQSSTAKFIHQLEQNAALDYTIIVDADAKESALNQYLAPYAGCTIGEYFMYKGKDVLIIYDDLSSHAIAYRELSLLLRRPPGREAYPGDIFYIHSRLLERAGQLSKEYGGGSLTSLPIIQTQGDDISAYIPTNLISITDGQIFLDTTLFNRGVMPAINIGLSVSRVGGAAQTKAIKSVSSSLKLELAQYNELLAFSQFGSELDKSSQKALDRGERALEILKQDEQSTCSFVDQTLFLFLLKENFLDKLQTKIIKNYIKSFVNFVEGAYKEIYDDILKTKNLSKENVNKLKKVAEEFDITFSKKIA
jgi:F-type H+/Na+-transporting ATPase subunit alpha